MCITKAKPSKHNKYKDKLDRNDAINVVESIESSTRFVRKNTTAFGIDTMCCHGVSSKLCARNMSQVANNNACLLNALRSMNVAPNTPHFDEDSSSEVSTHPGSIFCYDNCAVRVQLVSDDDDIRTVTL